MTTEFTKHDGMASMPQRSGRAIAKQLGAESWQPNALGVSKAELGELHARLRNQCVLDGNYHTLQGKPGKSADFLVW